MDATQFLERPESIIMNDPIHDIVKRLAILEGRITPTQPLGSQNPQQKSVHQLPALFKPGKGGPILGGDPNKKAVTKGYFVGAESEEKEEEPIEEAVANEEKLLDKVKKSFIDYLDSVEDAVGNKRDRDIGDKPVAKDIGKKAVDKDILTKTLDEDPTQEPAPADQPAASIQEPTYAAQPAAPVKTITLEDGRICEIHGDEHTGFEIRHGNRRLPSRFRNLDHATMAMEMYQARCKMQDQSADYIDEA
jgi:hypothetical protein